MPAWAVRLAEALAAAAFRSLMRVVRRPAPPAADPPSPRTHADVAHIDAQIDRATAFRVDGPPRRP